MENTKNKALCTWKMQVHNALLIIEILMLISNINERPDKLIFLYVSESADILSEACLDSFKCSNYLIAPCIELRILNLTFLM